MKKIFLYFAIIALIFSMFLANYNNHSYASDPVTLISIDDEMTRQGISVDSSHELRTWTTQESDFEAGDEIWVQFEPGEFSFRHPEGAAISSFFLNIGGGWENIYSINVGEPDCTGSMEGNDIAIGLLGGGANNYVKFKACDNYIIKPNIPGAQIGIFAADRSGGNDFGITNPSLAGQYRIDVWFKDDLGATKEYGWLPVNILDNDQISVDATIDPFLNFTISNSNVGFGKLTSSSAPRFATSDLLGADIEPGCDEPTKFIISTNAKNGAQIAVKSQGDGAWNAGLYSTITNELIEAKAAGDVDPGAAGTDGYGVYGKCANGLNIDWRFSNSKGSDGPITTNFETFASESSPMSSASADLAIKAEVSATTSAGTYTDTITVRCVGNF